MTDSRSELMALAEELREYTALKYMGNCKCGKCKLVPDDLVRRLYAALRIADSQPDREMVARTVERLAYRLTPNQQSALVSAIMSLGPITFSLPSRDSIKQAIHEGLGGNGWAYSDYGGDELNDCHDKLGGAADAILLLLVGGDQKKLNSDCQHQTEQSGKQLSVPMPRELSDCEADAALRATAVWLDVKGSQLTVNREKMKARYHALVKHFESRT